MSSGMGFTCSPIVFVNPYPRRANQPFVLAVAGKGMVIKPCSVSSRRRPWRFWVPCLCSPPAQVGPAGLLRSMAAAPSVAPFILRAGAGCACAAAVLSGDGSPSRVGARCAVTVSSAGAASGVAAHEVPIKSRMTSRPRRRPIGADKPGGARKPGNRRPVQA